MTQSLEYSDKYVFNGGESYNMSSVMIDATRILVSYRDHGDGAGAGTSIIGTIVDDVITWGTEVRFNTGRTEYISSVMLDATHVCISFQDDNNSDYGTAIIGTIVGTSISFGSEYVFNSGDTSYISSTLIDSTHVLISYRDYGNVGYGTAIIGTITGNTISFGSEYIFCNKGDTHSVSANRLDATHVMISYYSGEGSSVIGTITGNTISFGSEYDFNVGGTDNISSVTLDTTHVLVSYRDGSNSNYGTAVIGTIIGNTISFGSKYEFYSNSLSATHSSVMIDSTHVMFNYKDDNNSDYGTSIVGTIDGDVVTFGDEVIFNSGSSIYIDSVKIDSTHICINYTDVANSWDGTSTIGTWDSGEIMVFRPDLITELYNMSSVKGNLRGKALEGFIRPTIKQFFTSENFEEIIASYELSGKSSEQFDSSITGSPEIVTLSSTKICISYSKAGSYYCIVGSIDEDAVIAFGTPVLFTTAAMEKSIVAMNDTQVIVCYRYNVPPFYARTRVGTISGNSISFADEQTYTSTSSNKPDLVKLDDTRVCSIYVNSNVIVKVGNLSGTSVTFGSAYSIPNSDVSRSIGVVTIDSNKLLIYYRLQSGGAYKAIIATISGTIVTFGIEYTFLPSSPSVDEAVKVVTMTLIDTNKILILYSYYTAAWVNEASWRIADIDGTDITFSDSTQLLNYPVFGFDEMGLFDENKIGIIVRTYEDTTYEIRGLVGEIEGNDIIFNDISLISNDPDRPYYTSTTMFDSGKFCTSVQFLTGTVGKAIVLSLIHI